MYRGQQVQSVLCNLLIMLYLFALSGNLLAPRSDWLILISLLETAKVGKHSHGCLECVNDHMDGVLNSVHILLRHACIYFYSFIVIMQTSKQINNKKTPNTKNSAPHM